MTSLDSFRCCKTLQVGSKTYAYFSLPTAEKNGLKGISRLPFSMKVLLENLLRNEDGRTVTKDDIKAVAEWLKTEVLRPRDRLPPGARADAGFHRRAGGGRSRRHARRDEDAGRRSRRRSIRWCRSIWSSTIRCCRPSSATTAFKKNVDEEYRQNQERYKFLKWAQRSFDNFRVVPPGTGICHQVNLEYLSRTVWTRKDKVKVDGKTATMELAYPDTLVGTDSHTTMVNGLSVLGWGVGGIEARSRHARPAAIDAAARGDRLQAHRQAQGRRDRHRPGAHRHRRCCASAAWSASSSNSSAPASTHLTIADRATIGNMAPEYGATCGFFADRRRHHCAI